MGSWPRTRLSSESARWICTLSLVALVVLAFSLALGHYARDYKGVDVDDEGAHYDYVMDLVEGHIPAWGDLYQQRTLRTIQCVGSISNPRGSCAVTYRNPRDYPPLGYNYEAQQPPLGYIPYVLMARPNAAPAQALLDARRGGEIWTAIAALALIAVAIVESLSVVETGALLSLCLLCPVYVHAAATVNNDSASLAAGALVVWTASYSRRHGRRFVALGLGVGLCIGFLKGIFIVAPFVVLLADLLNAEPWRRDLTRPSRMGRMNRCACSFSMFVGAAASYLAWIVIQSARAKVPSSVVLKALLGFSQTKRVRFDSIVSGFQQLLAMWQPPFYSGAPLYYLWDVSVIACLVAVVVIKRRADVLAQYRNLALAVLVGMSAVAVGWPVLVYLQGHYNEAAAARYGLPLLPPIALIVVRCTRKVGLTTVGILLPAAAGVSELVVGKF
jgi:hypothetical protein